MNAAKNGGSIFLSIANKDLAESLTHLGIFLNYDYHWVTRFKTYPAQCFKCLQMGNFGKWCRQPAQFGRCNKDHMTKDFPAGPRKITECFWCKEGIHIKEEGIENPHHLVFSNL